VSLAKLPAAIEAAARFVRDDEASMLEAARAIVAA
jgi:hypothetical protein